MDGHSYVTKSYSNYTDVPTHDGGYGYGYGPKEAVNYYVVETTTIERVRGPPSRYTNFGGAPSKGESFKEYTPEYAYKDHYEDYDPNYGSDHENSSPLGFREQENLMNKFLNKVQIGASRPTKITNHSSPTKYRPTSPSHNYHSDEPHKIKSQTLSGQDKYRPTSPTHYYPSEEGHKIKTQNMVSGNKYRPTSPTRSYPSQEGHKITPHTLTDRNKYRPSSPNRSYPSEEGHNSKTHKLSSPNKYRPTSPTYNYPSEGGHNIKPQNLSGPNNYRPTSPIRSYPTEEGHKNQNFSIPNKYRPTSPTHTQNLSGLNKYRPTSPTHKYPSEEGHKIKSQNLNGPTKEHPTSQVHTYPSKEGDLIRTSSSPNRHRSSSPISEGGRYVRTRSFPVPDNHWQSVGPPMTHHPLTTPTNDINEALSFLTESVNYSPRSGPKRTGWFNIFGLRTQPVETERRYAKPGFSGATTQAYFGSSTIDSQEAMRKYNGARVP